ncbi:hypothetical protein JCM10207_001774 [Rhodosporidiobolus poonsookiae]
MDGDPNLYPETPPSLHPTILQQHQHLSAAVPLPQGQPAQPQLPPQAAYPATVPSTPVNHGSPASVTSPKIKISPETLAKMTGGAVQAGSPFSAAASVISPTGSTFSTGHLSDISAGGSGDGSAYGMSAALALANAVGVNGAGSHGGVAQLGAPTMLQQSAQGMQAGAMSQLGMEVDLAFPTPPQSGPASTGGSTPAGAPQNAFYYSNSSANTLPSQLAQPTLPPPSHPAPTLPPTQRHHPYAHPSRPTIVTAHTSNPGAIPLYLSTPSPAGPAPTPPPQSATSEVSSNNFGLGLPPVAPHGPQRVHSAPAHILRVATHGLDNHSASPLPSADLDGQGALDQRRLLGDLQTSFVPGGDPDASLLPPATPLGQGSGAASAPIAGTPTSALGPAFGAGMSLDAMQQAQAQVPPPPASVASVTAGEDERMMGYNETVSAAISLLGKRLPIMEAALSSSETEPGHDEEEIWKGIEGAYEELKRIMGERKEVRRQGMGVPPSKGAGSKRAFSTMELESPVTPVDRPHAASAFLAAHAPPPLHHAHSSPDVPLSAQAAAARQAAAAQAQALQLQKQQQAQLQQAQMQAQAQAEAHARAQAQLQAEADRARAEAEQRARAEEEARQQMEAEAQARAEAEAEAAAQQQRAEAARREAEQYQQMLHEDQLRVARERLHQQMQEGAAGAPQVLPNPPAPTPTPQPPPAQQQQQQTPQPLPQPPPQQPPPPQQQLVFATPQQAQAYALQMQGAQVAPNGAVLIPVLGHPPPGVPIAQASLQPVPNQLSQPLSIQGQFPAFDPSASGDIMMQQLQLQAMGFPPAPSLATQPDSVDPAALTGTFNPTSAPPSAVVSPQTVSPPNASTPTFATVSAASTGGGPGPVRPSRSRAASQSGYTSSGSRSRAASGSGYQVLLESRSRAASSASSAVYHPPSAFERDEDLDDDDDVEHDIDVGGGGASSARLSSQMGAASAGVDAETTAKMDPIFIEFLAEICSNLDATDSKGEPIHQTLMAKKMEKLDQSHDFRPFKFRIQAFTNAFAERLTDSGVFEQEVPVKKVRQYLWAQPYISRFNDDGKKAKSKGNHIWTVEAKKIPDKRWIFREFTRCIKGLAPPVAFTGVTWTWAPRVWDPQCSSAAIDASFMSPSLPPWLSWEDNILSGEVPESAHGQKWEIEAVATFQIGDQVQSLKASTQFIVASPTETDDPAAFAAANNIRPRQTRDTDRSRLDVDEDFKPNTSGNSSQVASPAGSASALYRSPSLGSSVLLEPPNGQLLPPPLNGSGGSSYSNSGLVTPASTNGLDAAFAPLDTQTLPDPSWPGTLQQDAPVLAMDMQMDDGTQSALEQQAAIHQQYMAMQQQQQHGAPFDAVSPATLSFAPPPELVSSALQDAAIGIGPAFSSIAPGLMSVAASETGTPGGFPHLHDMGQQPPFVTTLDPSQM